MHTYVRSLKTHVFGNSSYVCCFGPIYLGVWTFPIEKIITDGLGLVKLRPQKLTYF